MPEHRCAAGASISKAAWRRVCLRSARRAAWIALCLIALAPPAGAHEPHPFRIDADKLMGPKACGECHKPQVEAWRRTRHATAAHNLARDPKAVAIANAMGLKRAKEAGLCLDCHFSADARGDTVVGMPLVGVSCESCHGAAKDWIRRHSRYGMKESSSQSIPPPKGHAGYIEPRAMGLTGPADLYAQAVTCFGCHFVNDAMLVDTAGHPAGGRFEFVAWSQGEIRHNFWYSTENRESSATRKRKMFIIGKTVEIEFALRALGRAGAPAAGRYVAGLKRRLRSAADSLRHVHSLAQVPPADAVLQAVSDAAGAPPGDARYARAADAVAAIGQALNRAHFDAPYAAIDILIPRAEAYLGRPPR